MNVARNWIKRGKSNKLDEIILSHITKEELEDTTIYPIKLVKEAVIQIKEFIRKKYEIHIIGDYDCDGIMATAILKLALKKAGCTNLKTRLPKRFSEGYGLSEKIVDEIPANSVIITVDNGIAAKQAIKKAKEKGCYVILTDHHLAPTENEHLIFPDADIIIDPSAVENSCDFTGYCGAGIAFKIATELLGKDHPLLSALESLAGIATIADVMPLIRENRTIVKHALNHLMDRKSTVGVNAILDLLNMQYITETDIGYQLGPIINASGRMRDDGASEILELVSINEEEKYEKALELAGIAVETNHTRKDLQNTCIKVVLDYIEEQNMENDFPLIVYVPNIPEGLIGIVAGRLAEDFKTPAIVFSDTETDGVIKGSGRSYNGVHLKNLLDANKSFLGKYGGHPGAAGMSMEKKNLDAFRQGMKEAILSQGYVQDKNDYYDIEMDAKYIPVVLQKLLPYAPFGEHNPPLIFKITNFELTNKSGPNSFLTYLGDEKQHLKLNGKYASAIQFNAEKKIDNSYIPLKWILYGDLSFNYYNNTFYNQVTMADCIEYRQEETSDLLAQLNTASLNR